MLNHPRLSALLLLALGACGQQSGAEPLVDFPVPPLRNAMFEMDALNRLIEPVVTDPAQAPAIASAARSMLRLSSVAAWAEYQASSAFFGEPERFNGYLCDLREGLGQLIGAAEGDAPDREGMRSGFIRAQQSCIACHKRFQPNI